MRYGNKIKRTAF
jgi:hypothetical protein